MPYNTAIEGMSKAATFLILAIFFLGMIFLVLAFAKWAFFLFMR